MFKWLAVLGGVLLMAMGVVQMVAYSSPEGDGSENFFLPMMVRDFAPPIIDFFEANVEVADPGDTIELSWSTTNVVSTTIYHLFPTGQLGTFWNVAPTGTMTYTIDPATRNQTNFLMFAGNEGNQYTSAGVQIVLTCPDTWFFAPAPDICPAAAALVSAGAEQHFEHGLMLWVEEQDRIYVLFDDQSTTAWAAFDDEWEEGMPEDDPTINPPPGFFQPQRGFGLVWREQMSNSMLVRDRLGWAVDMESGYETAVQATSYSEYNDLYIRAADGNVWRLVTEHSDWEKIIAEP